MKKHLDFAAACRLPGGFLFAEDMTGTGHSTRVIGDESRFTIIIPLE